MEEFDPKNVGWNKEKAELLKNIKANANERKFKREKADNLIFHFLKLLAFSTIAMLVLTLF